MFRPSSCLKLCLGGECIVSSEAQFETWWWPSERAETCSLSNKYCTTLLVVFSTVLPCTIILSSTKGMSQLKNIVVYYSLYKHNNYHKNDKVCLINYTATCFGYTIAQNNVQVHKVCTQWEIHFVYNSDTSIHKTERYIVNVWPW